MSKKKTYRGQRVQKRNRIGCGCFYCTGTDKEYRRMIEEKRIDKETELIINNVVLGDVIESDLKCKSCDFDISKLGFCPPFDTDLNFI